MKLGLLVNTDANLKDITGLTEAALRKGHHVLIFAMDAGVRLLVEPSFLKLSSLAGVSVSFCEHSLNVQGLTKDGLPGEIECGSQYNNAVMNHDVDRVIIL